VSSDPRLVQDLGLGSWPARRARIAPDAIAFRQGGLSRTYRECAGRVADLAGGLAAAGVRPGDRVAYLGANDVATFEMFFATGRRRAIFAPLSTRSTAPELAYLLGDLRPRVLVHGPELAELVAQVDLAGAGTTTVIATTAGGRVPDLDDLAGAGRHAGDHPAGVGLDDPALILYTSGTTGRPKGAVLTHGNLTFNTMSQLAHVDVLERDVVLCTAPLFHIAGFGQVSLPTLFKGGTVVMAPRFDPAWLFEAVAAHRIAAFSAVPTMLQMCVDHPGWSAADLSSLRYVVYGGSPASERVARAWLDRGVTVLQGYGMTEASPGVFLATAGGARERPTSPGVDHFYVDTALLGRDGTIRPGPGSGELVVRGPNVFAGYWDRPGDTAGAWASGWFKTGDVATVDGEGWAQISDRVKDLIISGGENIYPAEVEAAITELPGVADVAVVAVPDERWGEVGRAFVVVNDAAVTADAIRAHLDGRLARFKIPASFRFVDALPRTPTGKVRKADLRRS
jgi:fatty-acyl-CoA synthase